MDARRGVAGGLALLGLIALTAGAGDDAKDEPKDKDRAVLAKLDKPIPLNFKDAPLEDVLHFIKSATSGPGDPGIPIYVDPVGLQEAEKTMTSPVTVESKGEPLKTSLKRLLKPLGLTYTVKDGLLLVTSVEAADEPLARKAP